MFKQIRLIIGLLIAASLFCSGAKVEGASKWKDNKFGILDPQSDAPTPWTNLKAKGTSVECWGRTYTFGDKGLPGSIAVLGEDILAGPIMLDVETTDGKIHGYNVVLKEAGPQKVVFTGEGGNADCVLKSLVEMEFDGMVKYSLEIVPKKSGMVIKKLSLVIPFKKKVAKFVYPQNPRGRAENCVLKEENPWQLDKFNPHIWIGNEERGLAWFAEWDRGWNVKHNPYFKTEFSKGRASFIVTIIDEKVTLESTLQLVFGLQATPMRPRRADFKKLHFRTKSPVPNFGKCPVRPWYQKYRGFPQAPDDTTRWEKMLQETKYLMPVIYVNSVHDQHPFYKFYQDRLEAPGTRFPGAGSKFEGFLVYVKGYDKLWQDYFVYNLHEFIKKWNVRGLYHDCWGPQEDEEGRVHIFDFREYVKRIYIVHRQLVPDALTVTHTNPWIPCIAFTDATLKGEQRRVQLAVDGYYLSFMDLETFRLEYYVVNFGTQPMILGQYKMGFQNDLGRSVQFVGLCFLHDATIWASFMNMQPFYQMEPIRMPWREEGTFHPYWKSEEPGFRVKADSEAIKVSYYEKPEGLFLVVVNTTSEEVESSLKVDVKGLNLAKDFSATIHEPLTGNKPGYTQADLQKRGGIPVNIEPYSVVLVEIE